MIFRAGGIKLWQLFNHGCHRFYIFICFIFSGQRLLLNPLLFCFTIASTHMCVHIYVPAQLDKKSNILFTDGDVYKYSCKVRLAVNISARKYKTNRVPSSPSCCFFPFSHGARLIDARARYRQKWLTVQRDTRLLLSFFFVIYGSIFLGFIFFFTLVIDVLAHFFMSFVGGGGIR